MGINQPDFISAIVAGDRTGLSQMYKLLFPAIRKLVQDFGGTEADAKDVFQDATIVIYEKAQKPDFQLSLARFFMGFVGTSGCRVNKKNRPPR